MDLEKRGGVWRPRRGAEGQEVSAGGEAVDPNLDPEQALIAKQEKGEQFDIAHQSLTPAQNRARLEGLRKKEAAEEDRLDRAA